MKIKLCKDCDYESVSVKLIPENNVNGYRFCYYAYKRHLSDDWYMLVEYTTGTPMGFDSSLSAIQALLVLWLIKKDKMIEYLNKQEKLNLKGAKRVQVRTEPKIGRNDPCTCGSGIKYKKCCLWKP